jgi:hypothetical protein
MKQSGMKTVQDLEGELKLITSSDRTWAIWVRVFHAHTNGKLINLETEKKYKEDLKIKVPPIVSVATLASSPYLTWSFFHLNKGYER